MGVSSGLGMELLERFAWLGLLLIRALIREFGNSASIMMIHVLDLVLALIHVWRVVMQQLEEQRY